MHNRAAEKWRSLLRKSDLLRLDAVCTILSRAASRSIASSTLDVLPLVSKKDLIHGPIAQGSAEVSTSDLDAADLGVAPPGSILISTYSGSLRPELRLAVVERHVAFARDIVALLPNNAVADPLYLYWLLRANEAEIKQLSVTASGSMRAIEWSSLRAFLVPIPSVPLQRSIAGILSRSHRILRLHTRAAAKTRDLYLAKFNDIFGDLRLNRFAWPMQPLGELTADVPMQGLQAKGEPEDLSGPRFIRVSDITRDGELRTTPRVSASDGNLERYLLSDGDLLVARSGHTVGKALLFRQEYGPCVFASYLLRYRPDVRRVVPEYLFGVTQTAYFADWVARTAHGAAQPNISGGEFSKFLVPVPPLEMQMQFADVASRIRSTRRRQELRADKVAALDGALMRHIFDVPVMRDDS